MFPVKNRFSLREQPPFFQTAQRYRGSFFTLLYQDMPQQNNQEEPLPQAACIAAKKNFPTAIARNKVKRQVRALLSPLLKNPSTKAVVVSIYQPIQTDLQKAELEDALQRILSRNTL